MLRIAIEKQPKSTILDNYEILAEILIKAFDLRHTRFSLGLENFLRDNEVDEIENAVFDSAIVMIYKLNDATFRPIFLKIWEWTTSSKCKKDDPPELYRRITFYGFLSMFFDSLQVNNTEIRSISSTKYVSLVYRN